MIEIVERVVYLMFTKNNFKIKCEIGGKINLYSCCKDCDFKKFETE